MPKRKPDDRQSQTGENREELCLAEIRDQIATLQQQYDLAIAPGSNPRLIFIERVEREVWSRLAARFRQMATIAAVIATAAVAVATIGGTIAIRQQIASGMREMIDKEITPQKQQITATLAKVNNDAVAVESTAKSQLAAINQMEARVVEGKKRLESLLGRVDDLSKDPALDSAKDSLKSLKSELAAVNHGLQFGYGKDKTLPQEIQVFCPYSRRMVTLALDRYRLFQDDTTNSYSCRYFETKNWPSPTPRRELHVALYDVSDFGIWDIDYTVTDGAGSNTLFTQKYKSEIGNGLIGAHSQEIFDTEKRKEPVLLISHVGRK